jgi:single-strand DNA-binding protein
MLNKAILVGNLGTNPEIRQTQTGSDMATFNIATTSKWKDRDGQLQEQTEWHRIVAFGRLADICGQYLRKGSKVYVEGRIQTQQWNDRDGNKRYTTQVVAQEMKILDSRNEYSKTDFAQGGQPEKNSIIDDWPPPERTSSRSRTDLSLAHGPYSDDEIPF